MQKRSAKKGTKCGCEPKKTMDSSGGSVQKKARTTTTKSKTEHGEEEEEEIVNVFSLEMDTLECDICSLPFESEVYSCKNGHAACANCCMSMDRKCPSCSEPIGEFRCRATEKILAGMTRPCRFKRHGCPETVRYTEARAHEEEACPFEPYRCPFDDCAYRGRLLYCHIEDAHEWSCGGTRSLTGVWWSFMVTLQKTTPFRALLLPREASVLLLLNSGDVLTGRSLSLVCVYPYADEAVLDDEYELKVMAEGAKGPWLLTSIGKLQFVRQLQGYKAKRFLFVPDDIWDSFGSITVSVNLLY